MLGCSEGATGPGGNQPENDLVKHIPLYSGSIGLVVDTRDIFKKGYKPASAAISFTGQAAFDTVLTIDSLTDVAILTIQNDSLSDAQKTAFANGIATTIIVQDASHTELGRLADVVPVDNSNSPVSITTPLPLLAVPPVLGGSGAAYLLQREGVGDLVSRFFGVTIGGNFSAYDEEAYQAPLTRPGSSSPSPRVPTAPIWLVTWPHRTRSGVRTRPWKRVGWCGCCDSTVSHQPATARAERPMSSWNRTPTAGCASS